VRVQIGLVMNLINWQRLNWIESIIIIHLINY